MLCAGFIYFACPLLSDSCFGGVRVKWPNTSIDITHFALHFSYIVNYNQLWSIIYHSLWWVHFALYILFVWWSAVSTIWYIVPQRHLMQIKSHHSMCKKLILPLLINSKGVIYMQFFLFCLYVFLSCAHKDWKCLMSVCDCKWMYSFESDSDWSESDMNKKKLAKE